VALGDVQRVPEVVADDVCELRQALVLAAELALVLAALGDVVVHLDRSPERLLVR
jgi:hypothetical protein